MSKATSASTARWYEELHLRLGLLAIIAVALSGCGGGGGSSAPQPTPLPPLGLTISCTPLVLYTFETSQCTASVEGTDNSPEWKVSSGMVDPATGFFVAPPGPGTVTIAATVRDGDRSVSDSVEITIRLRPLTVSRDPNLRDSRTGRTPLHIAALANAPRLITALVAAGADVEARDKEGLAPLHAAAAGNGPAAIAALVEAGAKLDALDNGGKTPLHAAVGAGNQVTMGMLLALGANWTSESESDADPADLNARIVTMEMFQGPMVWQWELDELRAGTAEPGMSEASMADNAKTLLHRAATVAVRIGSESPVPMPELSVNLSGADGRSWAEQADLVQGPNIVSLPSNSATGLWETEYVYGLPADWVETGHRASLAIDPYNRLEETDENDNTVTLTMDGHAVPVFDVTFVPIMFSGEPLPIDTATYLAVIDDLVPIGGHQVQIGRLMDLSDRNLGSFDTQLSKQTALRELLHRWNAEAGENEYYHGLLSTAELSFGFGGLAYAPGNVAVSDTIYVRCQVGRELCGGGTHAHELGHNFGLDHAPGNCDETEPIDGDFPYPDAGVGPRRGWVASRDEFVNSGDENRYRDLMSYCSPIFVSDYNYKKMVEHRLESIQTPPDASERRGPSLEIGPVESAASSMTSLVVPPPANLSPLGAAAPSHVSGPGVAVTDAVEAIGPSLAFTGAMDEYGLWSTFRIDNSSQPPRPPGIGGE